MKNNAETIASAIRDHAEQQERTGNYPQGTAHAAGQIAPGAVTAALAGAARPEGAWALVRGAPDYLTAQHFADTLTAGARVAASTSDRLRETPMLVLKPDVRPQTYYIREVHARRVEPSTKNPGREMGKGWIVGLWGDVVPLYPPSREEAARITARVNTFIGTDSGARAVVTQLFREGGFIAGLEAGEGHLMFLFDANMASIGWMGGTSTHPHVEAGSPIPFDYLIRVPNDLPAVNVDALVSRPPPVAPPPAPAPAVTPPAPPVDLPPLDTEATLKPLLDYIDETVDRMMGRTDNSKRDQTGFSMMDEGTVKNMENKNAERRRGGRAFAPWQYATLANILVKYGSTQLGIPPKELAANARRIRRWSDEMTTFEPRPDDLDRRVRELGFANRNELVQWGHNPPPVEDHVQAHIALAIKNDKDAWGRSWPKKDSSQAARKEQIRADATEQHTDRVEGIRGMADRFRVAFGLPAQRVAPRPVAAPTQTAAPDESTFTPRVDPAPLPRVEWKGQLPTPNGTLTWQGTAASPVLTLGMEGGRLPIWKNDCVKAGVYGPEGISFKATTVGGGYVPALNLNNPEAVAFAVRAMPELGPVIAALMEKRAVDLSAAQQILTGDKAAEVWRLIRSVGWMMAPEDQERVLAEGLPPEALSVLLTIQSGTDDFTLGDVSVRLWSDTVIEFVGLPARAAGRDGPLKAVTGWTYRGQQPDGRYANHVPYKQLPRVCRILDKLREYALATALRIAFLLDNTAPICDDLEELAAAGTMDAIRDPRVRAKVEEFMRLVRPLLPEGLDPYPYQWVGGTYARLSGYRCLLGDDMGLGKSAQYILAMLADPDKLTPTLIVAPGAVKINWVYEIQKWAPHLRVHVFDASGTLPIMGKADVVTCSYDALRLNPEKLQAYGFQCVVFDEAHKTKNAGTGRGSAADALAKVIPHVFELTGTSFQNRPAELWHLLHMLDPNSYPDLKNFKDRYLNQKQRAIEVRNPFNGKIRAITVADERSFNANELRDRLRCIQIRRIKSEVRKDLPEKRRAAIFYDLTPAQRREYGVACSQFVDEYRKKIRVNLASELAIEDVKAALRATGKNARLSLQTLELEYGPDLAAAHNRALRLPEFASLVEDRLNQAVEGSVLVAATFIRLLVGKFKIEAASDWAIEHLAADPDRPVILFAHHKEVVQGIVEKVSATGLRVGVIDGSISDMEKRFAVVQKFQNGEIDVLVAAVLAAGEGLNMTRANEALIVEYEWVPGWLAQAEDRLHRGGQLLPVTLYYLHALRTIDRYVYKALLRKQNVIDAVQGSSYVQNAEIAEIISAEDISAEELTTNGGLLKELGMA